MFGLNSSLSFPFVNKVQKVIEDAHSDPRILYFAISNEDSVRYHIVAQQYGIKILMLTGGIVLTSLGDSFLHGFTAMVQTVATFPVNILCRLAGVPFGMPVPSGQHALRSLAFFAQAVLTAVEMPVSPILPGLSIWTCDWLRLRQSWSADGLSPTANFLIGGAFTLTVIGTIATLAK